MSKQAKDKPVQLQGVLTASVLLFHTSFAPGLSSAAAIRNIALHCWCDQHSVGDGMASSTAHQVWKRTS